MSAELPPVAILAGGLGTRLHPITQSIPKALVEINGTPFLEHQLRLLQRERISHIVMCVGYLGELIRDYAGDGTRYSLRIDYVFDGDMPLGTAGALKNALPVLDDEFFVLYGDSYLMCNYANVHRRFTDSGKSALMTVYRNEHSWDTSNVVYANGVVELYDKHNPLPEMVYIDYGLSLVRASVLEDTRPGTPTDLADIYRRLSLQGQLAGYEVSQRFFEIGTPDGVQQMEAYLNSANDTE